MVGLVLVVPIPCTLALSKKFIILTGVMECWLVNYVSIASILLYGMFSNFLYQTGAVQKRINIIYII